MARPCAHGRARRPTTCPQFEAVLVYFAWTAHEGFWTTLFGDLTPGSDRLPPQAGFACSGRTIPNLEALLLPALCPLLLVRTTTLTLLIRCGDALPWPSRLMLAMCSGLTPPSLCHVVAAPSRPPAPTSLFTAPRDPGLASSAQSLSVACLRLWCRQFCLRTLCPRTAWAVLFQGGSFRFSAPLFGPDSTAAYAERSALWHAVAASAEAGVDIALLVDNQAVVRRLCRGLAGNVMGDCQGFWHEVLARWRPSNTFAWIPSHDKQQFLVDEMALILSPTAAGEP